MRTRWILLAPLLLAIMPASFAQQWFSVKSDHLTSYSSDAKGRGAIEAARRSEELIAVFGEIFNRDQVSFSTPLRVLADTPEKDTGAIRGVALIRTPAANYVTVDFAQPDSWPQAAKLIAGLTMEDNYPRAQPWFDSGIASFLAGIQFNSGQMKLGQPPPAIALPSGGEWIPLAKLLEINQISQLPPAQRAAFEAESWAVVQWLISNHRIAQAGNYLNAVLLHGTAPERALADAFLMSPAELDREVRESLAKPAIKTMPVPGIESTLKQQKLSAADVHAIEASFSLMGPEADRALNDLVAFMRVNQDNAAVHRALAWAFFQRNDLGNAVEHIRRALALDDSDAGMHYLYARWVNHGSENDIRIESAEAHMSTELKAALQRDPNYAAALELLGLAELSSGDTKPALASLQRASALRPRNSRYYLNLARAYEANGNLEAARNLMLYAIAGGDDAVSREAGESLSQLGKKDTRQQDWKAMGMYSDPNIKHSKYDNLDEALAQEEKEEAESKSSNSQPDMRKTEFLKGRIVSVECGSTADAILNVSSAGHTWKLHAADRNTAVLIGADRFDCGWRDTSVTINYKRSGNFQGDLVSLEIN